MGKKIYKWSLLYKIGWYYVYISHKLFYSKIVVKGLENIPSDSPVILAPNHQNAFMDALKIVCSFPGQTVFMARADVFQNKFLAKIFRFLKIMPVYRIRDGYENLEKNDAIFNEAVDVLGNKKVLCLMPEGTHGDRHVLKPLVKGIFRIALIAAEKFPGSPPVIIPVGIEYSDYYSFRSQVVIQYGKPIHVNEYSGLYKNNPAKAINDLREKLSVEMKKLMIHIDCLDLYETVDYLKLCYQPFGMRKLGYEKSNPWHRFLADKWFTDICNTQYVTNSEMLYNLKDDVAILHYKLDLMKLKPEILLKKSPGIFKIIGAGFLYFVLSPIFFFGYFTHVGFVRFHKIFTGKIEDPQFLSSLKYTVTTLFFPIYYGILWFLISFFTGNVLFQLLFLTGTGVLGEFAYFYFKLYINFKQLLKVKIFRQEVKSVYPLWKSTIERLDALCNCPNSLIG